MKQIFSIMLGFLPWIVFSVISGPSLFRLNASIIAALILVLIMGFKQLSKGFVLTWGSLLFFSVILVMVVFLRNMWFIGNLDILSQGTLALITWLSICVGINPLSCNTHWKQCRRSGRHPRLFTGSAGTSQ